MTFGSCGKKAKKKKKKKKKVNNPTVVRFSRNDDLVVSSFMQELVSFNQITAVDRFIAQREFSMGTVRQGREQTASHFHSFWSRFLSSVYFLWASFLVFTKSCQILHRVIQEVPNCVRLLLGAEVCRGDFIAFLSENSCLLQLKRTPWWLWQASTTVKTLAGQINNELKAETVALE